MAASAPSPPSFVFANLSGNQPATSKASTTPAKVPSPIANQYQTSTAATASAPTPPTFVFADLSGNQPATPKALTTPATPVGGAHSSGSLFSFSYGTPSSATTGTPIRATKKKQNVKHNKYKNDKGLRPSKLIASGARKAQQSPQEQHPMNGAAPLQNVAHEQYCPQVQRPVNGTAPSITERYANLRGDNSTEEMLLKYPSIPPNGPNVHDRPQEQHPANGMTPLGQDHNPVNWSELMDQRPQQDPVEELATTTIHAPVTAAALLRAADRLHEDDKAIKQRYIDSGGHKMGTRGKEWSVNKKFKTMFESQNASRVNRERL